MEQTALTTLESFRLPALGGQAANYDPEEFVDIPMDFPQVKIPSGGQLSFELPNPLDPDDPTPCKTIEGVIVLQQTANAYWQDSDTTGDSAMPPPNDAGGAGESGAAIGSAVPALYLAEAVEGITAERTLTLEFAPDGTVYATDVYTLANAGTEPVTVALAFDDAAASCTVDGVSVEDGTHVSLLKAGASAEIVLRSKAAVEGDTLALDSPVNLTVAEASLVLQNLPEGTVVSGTEPFDRIVQE